jgi:hypothetical protein
MPGCWRICQEIVSWKVESIGKATMDQSDEVTRNTIRLTRLRYTITLCSLLLALAHVIWPSISIDAITLILVVIAVLPWLTPFVKSLELPGG